jgi:hypothetical protein
MSFKNNFHLREDGVYILRGRFRDKELWEPCFPTSDPVVANLVYNLLETVYNLGEHDGRVHVRNSIKEALDIGL